MYSLWRRGRAIVVDRKARDRGGLLDPDEVANTGTWTDRYCDSDPRSEPEVSRIALAIRSTNSMDGPQW